MSKLFFEDDLAQLDVKATLKALKGSPRLYTIDAHDFSRSTPLAALVAESGLVASTSTYIDHLDGQCLTLA